MSDTFDDGGSGSGVDMEEEEYRRLRKRHLREIYDHALTISMYLSIGHDVPSTMDLSVHSHKKAAEAMCTLRGLLANKRSKLVLCGKSKMALLSAGLFSFQGAFNGSTSASTLMQTAMLLFDLMFCSINDDITAKLSREEIDSYNQSTVVWMDRSWSDTVLDIASVVASTPNSACTMLGIRCASDESLTEAVLQDMAKMFYTCARDATRLSVLTAKERRVEASLLQSFTTADMEARLQATVDAASSEVGQSALKDIVLSFLLPRRIVGCRRSILIDRTVAHIATQHYAIHVARAHEAAMCSANLIWTKYREGVIDRTEQPEYDIEVVASLLSGVAMLLSSSAEEARRGDAFKGRVELPFLCASPPSEGARISLLWGEWNCYTMTTSGKITVLHKQPGVEGLKRCVALLLASLKL